MWWDIIKSLRDEAYSKFLEEFGPGFEIWRLDRHGIEFRENRLIRDEWLIHMDNMGDITFHSEKYRPHLGFVQGIFKEEYPERYKEIGDLLESLILGEKEKSIIDSSNKLPDFSNMSISDREKWLKEHDFCYLANGNFVRQKVRNYLIGSLISFYEIKTTDNVTTLLSSPSYNFAEFTNIADLFYEYLTLMHNWYYNQTRLVRRKLNSTNGQFEILQDILKGRLLANPYYEKHLGRDGGVALGIRKRWEE